LQAGVKFELPEEIDLLQLLNQNVLREKIREFVALPPWVLRENVEVVLQRVNVTDTVVLTPTQRRRALLATMLQKRSLLQTSEDYAIWQLVLRVILGSLDADEATQFLEQMQDFVSSVNNVTSAVVFATNGAVTENDVVVVEGSSVALLSTSAEDLQCDASRGAVLDSGLCKCNKGFYGTPPANCIPCSVGTYSASLASRECSVCGELRTTGGVASVSEDACKCIDGYTEKEDTKAGLFLCVAEEKNDTYIIVIAVCSAVVFIALVSTVFYFLQRRGQNTASPTAGSESEFRDVMQGVHFQTPFALEQGRGFISQRHVPLQMPRLQRAPPAKGPLLSGHFEKDRSR
jgi:hypothetical protein